MYTLINNSTLGDRGSRFLGVRIVIGKLSVRAPFDGEGKIIISKESFTLWCAGKRQKSHFWNMSAYFLFTAFMRTTSQYKKKWTSWFNLYCWVGDKYLMFITNTTVSASFKLPCWCSSLLFDPHLKTTRTVYSTIIILVICCIVNWSACCYRWSSYNKNNKVIVVSKQISQSLFAVLLFH